MRLAMSLTGSQARSRRYTFNMTSVVGGHDMRITTVLLALALSACATQAAQTSWGKAGVSMNDYRLDSAQCIIEGSGGGPTQAAEASKSGNSNQTSSTTESRGGTNGPGGLTSGGAIVYSGSASPEDAN